MTVAATPSRIGFTGNGVTTVFNYPYYFQNQPDLMVFTYNTLTGAIVLLSLNIDYSISGVVTSGFGYESGANVTVPGSTLNVPAVLPATSKLVIFRNPLFLQNLSLPLGSPYPPAPIESEFDAVMLMMQRLSDLLSRSARLPDGLALAFDPTIPKEVALAASQGAVVIVNSTNSGFIIGPTADQIINAQNAAIAAAASAASAAASEAVAIEAAVQATESAADAAADAELAATLVPSVSLIDTSSGDSASVLPAANLGQRVIYLINKSFGSGNNINVTATGGDLINDQATDTIGSGEVRGYYSDGISNWYAIN